MVVWSKIARASTLDSQPRYGKLGAYKPNYAFMKVLLVSSRTKLVRHDNEELTIALLIEVADPAICIKPIIKT